MYLLTDQMGHRPRWQTVNVTKFLMKNRWVIEESTINPDIMNTLNGQVEQRKPVLPTMATNFI
jgi:hypothetical protein